MERKKLITENFKGCTQCGKCCTGFGSIRIYIDSNNVQQIADYLKITPNEFIQNYTLSTLKQSDETSLSIKYKPSLAFHKRVQCVFLKPQTQQDGQVTYSCSIYPVRPQQCRTFPHWDEEIVQDESYYNMIETCEALHSLKRSAFMDDESIIEEEDVDDANSPNKPDIY